MLLTNQSAARKNKVGVLDEETDPFLAGRVPFPFAACVYFGPNDYVVLWDTDKKEDFLARLARLLRSLPACTLYAHNGGRFDFQYLVEFADEGTIAIRNGRISKMMIGDCTLKDSFPLMPFALEEYRKTKIDYSIFERGQRNKPRNRRRITSYLIDDCAFLLELLTGFKKIVGNRDTIGSAAFNQMRRLGIRIESMNESHDSMFRPYFFGGRVEAFRKGIFNGPFQFFDINSAYPFAMLTPHAHGAEYRHGLRLPHVSRLGSQFIRCVADSRGALPLRTKNGGLSFPHSEQEFCATGWEIKAGIETNTLRVRKVLDVWTPVDAIRLSAFVDNVFPMKAAAKKAGDKIGYLAYKYLGNSGYGKFAQNPREFKEYRLAPFGVAVRGFEWVTDFGGVSLWQRSSYFGFGYFDVATGASITGYVRAMLWRAINASRDVYYVDTDSMICKSTRVKVGGALGQWKREGDGAHIEKLAIAGKKLYGVKWSRKVDGTRYKIASKGARLEWSEILDLCNGKSIIWTNDAPTFGVTGAEFLTRTINAT